ncbi:MAG TPA: short chain dehydrogenase [Gammaproteobacteria bacterium]|nr:short chain dehydrogenase [Gammaproteobacteria bacterium]
MKVLVIGGTGTIGRAVVTALQSRHDVIAAGHTGGDPRVEITSASSLRSLFRRVGALDAVVCSAGPARFGSLEQLRDEDFTFAVGHKLLGQVGVSRAALAVLRDGGSITLTSGILAGEPVAGSSAISMVNAGVEGYARAAALELPRNIRINVVSPPWVRETLVARGMEPDAGLPAASVARAYVDSVEGTATGRILDARRYD